MRFAAIITTSHCQSQHNESDDQLGLEDIANSLRNLKSELSVLKGTLPRPGKNKLGTKLKWVLDAKRVKEIVDRIYGHKLRLQLSIAVMGLSNDIKQFDNSRTLRDNLESLMQVPTQQNRLISQLDQLTADFERLQTTRTLTGTDSNVLARIVRAELQSMLVPALDAYFSQHQLRHESHLRILQTAIDRAVLDLLQAMEKGNIDNFVVGQQTLRDAAPHGKETEDYIYQTSGQSSEDRKSRSAGASDAHNESILASSHRIGTQNPRLSRPTVIALSWKYWNFNWLIGRLHIRLKTFRFAHGAAMTKGEKYEILVRFQPAAALMVCTGISLLSTVASDHRGYFQICPFIATFRIIDNDAPSRGAILNGDIDELRDLFSKGLARPSDRDLRGNTLLHIAAFSSNAEACRLLLSQGADPLAENDFGRTPIDLLHCVAFRKALICGDEGYTGRGGIGDVVESCMLIEGAGGDTTESFDSDRRYNLVNFYASDSVMTAQQEEALDIWLSFLHQRRVDFNTRYGGDHTPLMYCSVGGRKGQAMRIRILLRGGADLSARDSNGMQALHLAVYGSFRHNSRPERLERFLEIGDESVGDGEKILNPEWHESVVEVIVCLIKAGADIHATDNLGRTPETISRDEGTLAQWCDALDRCGIRKEDASREDAMRIAQWRVETSRLHSAKRTAVDADDLKTPSRTGLRKRKNYRTEVEPD